MRITQLSAKKPTKEFIEVLREKNRGKEKKIVCNYNRIRDYNNKYRAIFYVI